MESMRKFTSTMKKVDSRGGFLRAVLYNYKEAIDPFPYRRYMRAHKCVFVHIPKTAGTSLLEALGHTGPRDHSAYREFLKANPVRFEKYFKFAFVRHPYGRFVSTYKYLKLGGNKGGRDLFYYNLIKSKKITLDQFVDYAVNNKIYQIDPLFWPQCVYVCDPLNKVMVDYIGRYENLDKDFHVVAKRLSVNDKLKKINVSKSEEVLRLSQESKGKLAEVYAQDFNIFGYEESSNV